MFTLISGIYKIKQKTSDLELFATRVKMKNGNDRVIIFDYLIHAEGTIRIKDFNLITTNFAEANFEYIDEKHYEEAQNALLNGFEKAYGIQIFEDAEAGLSKNETELIQSGQLLDAVRSVKSRTGKNLKEAKKLVDDYRVQLRNKSKKKTSKINRC